MDIMDMGGMVMAMAMVTADIMKKKHLKKVYWIRLQAGLGLENYFEEEDKIRLFQH